MIRKINDKIYTQHNFNTRFSSQNSALSKKKKSKIPVIRIRGFSSPPVENECLPSKAAELATGHSRGLKALPALRSPRGAQALSAPVTAERHVTLMASAILNLTDNESCSRSTNDLYPRLLKRLLCPFTFVGLWCTREIVSMIDRNFAYILSQWMSNVSVVGLIWDVDFSRSISFVVLVCLSFAKRGNGFFMHIVGRKL